ncbi:uncharacterized protein [Henckelia pumila]|uniref:uncharacterized protein n=1 Tax=Henckelia pumila TaxID=405737 RepID=UPI003C6E355D
MRTAQSRQKSYADARRRDLEFAVGDHVFLKVSPMKGVARFGRRGKLNPRYIGPFEILERVGTLAYRLALPPGLAAVHNVFHVSMLRRYVSNPSHVLDFEPLQLPPDLVYEERPVRILAREERRLRTRVIPMVRVQWLNHSEEEATWETEEDMRTRYPELFGLMAGFPGVRVGGLGSVGSSGSSQTNPGGRLVHHRLRPSTARVRGSEASGSLFSRAWGWG